MSSMKLYRFSPIKSEKELLVAIEYVFDAAGALSQEAIGRRLPVSYLTVFAHYNDEYDALVEVLSGLGKLAEANNGVKVELHDPIKDVSSLRVRKPDPYRMQVGCCDFAVEDYDAFKQEFLPQSKSLRLITRPDYEMIEFFHPDFDVLGYVVSADIMNP